jgi:hypothetical protein
MSIVERLLALLGLGSPPAPVADAAVDRREILRILAERCTAAGERTFVYRSEWAGYFPNPLTHWVEVGGKSVSEAFPRGWSRDDLDALVDAGAARRLGEKTAPDDEYDLTATYELSASSRDSPA